MERLVKNMKTILVTTYSPCIHGSYGIVSREIFKRIYESGDYHIVHHAWFHIELANDVPWDVIPTNQRIVNGRHELDNDDIHGQKTFKEVLNKVKPDIVWALGDFYMLKHVFDEKVNHPNVQFVCHLAVDGEPWHRGTVSPIVNADDIVAISRYGAETIEPLVNRPVPHIWHGVDTEQFYPLDKEQKLDLRMKSSNGKFNDKAFVAGFVGKDQYRKQNDKIWEYVHYMVHGDYIECKECSRVTLREWDSRLARPRDLDRLTMYDAGYDYSYCSHCRSTDVINGKAEDDFYGYIHMPYKPNDAWNPDQLSDIWKIQGRMFNTKGLGSNKGIEDSQMVSIYNLFDIMYYPSGGEGFGMPVLEAMACGVPTMYTNYSAHAEVAGDCGIPLKVSYVTEMMSCYSRARADTADAVAKTLKLIRNPKLLEPLKERGIAKADENTWDKIGADWLSFINGVADRCTDAIGVVI